MGAQLLFAVNSPPQLGFILAVAWSAVLVLAPAVQGWVAAPGSVPVLARGWAALDKALAPQVVYT